MSLCWFCLALLRYVSVQGCFHPMLVFTQTQRGFVSRSELRYPFRAPLLRDEGEEHGSGCCPLHSVHHDPPAAHSSPSAPCQPVHLQTMVLNTRAISKTHILTSCERVAVPSVGRPIPITSLEGMSFKILNDECVIKLLFLCCCMSFFLLLIGMVQEVLVSSWIRLFTHLVSILLCPAVI